jgi:alpha-tubulin suppressor-like RCC1 family protein
VKALEGQKINGLSCGTSHSFGWSSETGLVFGWGLGLNGRLGNEYEGVVQDPQVLECFREA